MTPNSGSPASAVPGLGNSYGLNPPTMNNNFGGAGQWSDWNDALRCVLPNAKLDHTTSNSGSLFSNSAPPQQISTLLQNYASTIPDTGIF